MNSNTKRITGWCSGAAGLAILLVAIFAINMIAGNLRIRHDFTEEKLYTLSDGTRAILSGLDRDVVLKFYFSRSMRGMPMALKSYARQVEDLLKEYELAGRGRVSLETYDPEPDSDEEEWALKYGLEPQAIDAYGSQVFFGIVAVGEGEEAIPVLSPRNEQSLEYELTRMVSRAAHPAKPVIGVLSPLGVLGSPARQQMPGMRPRNEGGWLAFNELRRDYDLREVAAAAAEIPAEITTLVIVHPRDLPDATLYAIDQFALRGGHILAFVDPFSRAELLANADSPMAMYGGANGPSTLGRLFDAWGVGFDTMKVAADMRAVTRVSGGAGRIEETPVVLSLADRNMSKSALLTSRLNDMLMPYAGAFTLAAKDGVESEAIITTGADSSCMVDSFGIQAGMQAIRAQLRPDNQEHILAARLSGVLDTAFPEGAPADGTNAPAATAQHLARGTSPASIVIVADADMISDDVCVRIVNIGFGMQIPEPMNDNLAFFLNAVEQVSGNPALIGIRSRGRSNRPFEKVDDLAQRAAREYQAQEQQLSDKLMETRRKIAELQRQKQDSQKAIISKEQRDAIAEFRREEAAISHQLREVRHNLRKDIDALGARLKFINIALMPIIVVIAGICVAVARRRAASRR